MSGDLIYRKKVIKNGEHALVSLSRTMMNFLGVHHGDKVVLIVDRDTKIPSLILRKDVEEA